MELPFGQVTSSQKTLDSKFLRAPLQPKMLSPLKQIDEKLYDMIRSKEER